MAIGRAGGENPGDVNDVDDYLLFELRETQRLPVAHIAAPVFDPEGTVRLALTVVAFRDQLTSQEIPVVMNRLTAATARVARAAMGGEPGDTEPFADPVARPTHGRTNSPLVLANRPCARNDPKGVRPEDGQLLDCLVLVILPATDE